MKRLALMGLVAVTSMLTGTSARLGPPSHSPAIMTASSQLRHPSTKLPPAFEANLGQINDEAQFTLRARDYTIFLTRLEVALVLKEKRLDEQTASTERRVPRRASMTANRYLPNAHTEHVVRMRYVGANPQATIRGIARLSRTSRYFIGNDPSRWRVDVPHYAGVRYENLYPGIDLLYHGSREQLEYDFVVAPGADPGVIRLAFDGDVQREIESGGDLVLHTGGQTLRHGRPVLYQDVRGARVEVQGRYVERERREVGFQVGAYDRTRPLVIDPTLAYATYLGGDAGDNGEAIAVDASGQAIVVGVTRSANFPTRNPLQGAIGTDKSIVFVTKLNAAGTDIVYSTYLGGTSFDPNPPAANCIWCVKNEFASGIALDADGNVYITGATYAINFPITPGAFQRAYYGQGDAFVAKLSASGTLLYSTYVGSSGLDWALGIAVDRTGCVYLTGGTQGADFPTTPMALQTKLRGLQGVFVAKLNAEGTALVYSTHLGGATGAYQWGNGITVDAAGSAYVVGKAAYEFPTTPGAFHAGLGYEFVAKLNGDGTALVYSTRFSGSAGDPEDEEEISAIAVDADGSAYLAGYSFLIDYPTTPGALFTQAPSRNPNCAKASPGAGYWLNAIVTKLNAEGSHLTYSTYLGGCLGTSADAIAVDAKGSVYVVGSTNAPDFPTSPDAVQPAPGGGTSNFGSSSFPSQEAFVTKLNPAGTQVVYSTYLGGTRFDWGRAIALDPAGAVYVTGGTESPDFPTTRESFQPLFGGGGSDAFVAKIDLGTVAAPARRRQ